MSVARLEGRLAVSLRELADLTGLSTGTLRAWAREGLLETRRVRRKILVPVREIYRILGDINGQPLTRDAEAD